MAKLTLNNKAIIHVVRTVLTTGAKKSVYYLYANKKKAPYGQVKATKNKVKPEILISWKRLLPKEKVKILRYNKKHGR